MMRARFTAIAAQAALLAASMGLIALGLSWSASAWGQTPPDVEAQPPAEDPAAADAPAPAEPPADAPAVEDPLPPEVPSARVRVRVDPATGDILVEKFETAAAAAAGEPVETATFLNRLDFPSLWERNDWRRWLILLGAIFAGVVAGRITAGVLRKIGDKWTDRGWTARGGTFASAASPASLALTTVGIAVGLSQLRLSQSLHEFSAAVVGMLFLIAGFWYAYNLVAVFEIFMRHFAARSAGRLDNQLVPLIRKTLRIFIVVVAVLVILEVVFKADVGAALAGFGIAGLAVSLAAQDSLKNLFGSITILFDEPFQVGERIIFQGYDGIVEEIGLRSTKLRTFTGHVITIPNSAIVNESVENPQRRPFLRRMIDVTLAGDTPPDKIEEAVRMLRDLLASEEFRGPIHPTIGTDELPPRVYFNDLAADGPSIQVMYWYAPPAWWDYMEHAQRFNLELLRRFEAAGIDFAYPTRTVYLAQEDRRELAVRLLERDLNHGDAER
ncbi:MAG: mechanosensitive ion channel family protein [Planctomycetaceae bacterium]